MVKDAMTGRPLPNAVISTRNVTRINETHARNDVIKHDITSGKLRNLQDITPILQLVS